jgi:predicted Zn finger-like uncharacterized protein
MKITCPKCDSTYKIDLPDSDQAGIDVQCGKCQNIFRYNAGSDLPKDRSSEPILPPQKDEDQVVSDLKKRALSSPERDSEISDELELEPIADDPEAIEIIIENEPSDDSLEKGALEDIWNQAVQEGAQTVENSKKKSSAPPSKEPVSENDDRVTPEENPPAEKSESGATQKDAKPGKPEGEIDLEEQGSTDQKETQLGWEEAFAHQAEVESGWKKAQEQDRIQEEQQLKDALSKEALAGEPPGEEKDASAPQENLQSLVDEVFAEVKGSQESPKEAAKTPPAEPEAQTQQEKPEEKIDLEKQVTEDKEKNLPSWEDAFAHQAKVETGWKKAQEEDRIHEEQQLADALGEEYQPSDTPAEETAATEPQEEKQSQVDQLFAELKPQQETPDQPEAQTQDEPQDESREKAPSSEIEETHVDQHTIPGAIDLMTDLDDLNMKQMVSPDFREEPETLEDIEPSEATPSGGEMAQELDLTMESSTEMPLEAEPPPVEPTPELEMEAIPDLTLESAEEDPEIELDLQMESESEFSNESPESAAPSPGKPDMGPEALYDKEREEIWSDLLSDQNGEVEPVAEIDPKTLPEEEEAFGGDDFWDQVLEKDSKESQTEAEQQPVSSAPAQDMAERETLTDEELCKEAFPGEKDLEPTPSQNPGEEKEDSASEATPLVFGARLKQDEESEDPPDYDEAAYADFEDEEFEFQRRKRKLGPFTIPHGRRGDLVIGGAMVVFLLLAGSVYFTLQTFAPGELTDIQKAETEVPEGLTPREVPLDELVEDLTSPKPEKTPPVDKPGDKGEATLSDPAKILEESPEEKGILKDLAESQILKDTGKAQTANIDQSALQGLSGHSVTMSTIMPVAYNPTDIRVLSFSVEIQLSNAQSAKAVRESMPVYEEIMNQTVEDFLRRKFYNDILYVKEKLQKRLQTAMNKSLKNGRVRKTKFTEFAIQ